MIPAVLLGASGLALANPETNGFTISASTRIGAQAGYYRHYEASQGFAARMGWTGANLASNIPGTVAQAYHDDTLRRINYYRAQAGLPADIVFDATKNTKSQWAAMGLAKHADYILSHNPDVDWAADAAIVADKAAHGTPSWAHQAASAGNISKGSHGPDAVDSFMVDTGNTNSVVGHRRWFLYPRGQEMGNGGIPSTGNLASQASGSCIWVNGNYKASSPATTKVVAWPNAGYVPYNLIPNVINTVGFVGTQKRWSCAYTNGDFSAATVTMTRTSGAGAPASVPVTKETYALFYGDNTLVWRFNSDASIVEPVGSNDISYSVQISGITVTGSPPPEFTTSNGGVSYNYTYTVTTFDPTYLPQSMTLTGSATPPVGLATTYALNSMPESSANRVKMGTLATSAFSEGSVASPTIINNTTTGTLQSAVYWPVNPLVLHLAFPASGADQSFEINRDLVPSNTSALTFDQLFRFFTLGSSLKAEISTNQGGTWAELWNRSGTYYTDLGNSLYWEGAFGAFSIPIPAAYTGKVVRIRFRITNDGGYFPGFDDSYGAFLDNITMTNSQQMTTVSTTALAGNATSFNLTPPSAGTYVMLAQTEFGGTHWFDYGPLKTVTVSAAAPAAIQTWRNTNLGTSTSTGLAADTADKDGDGLANLMEFAFNLNPNTPTVSSPDLPVMTKVGSNMVFVFKPSAAALAGGVTYAVQKSTTLAPGSWTAVVAPQLVIAGGVYTATVPISGAKTYLRLQVTNSLGL